MRPGLSIAAIIAAVVVLGLLRPALLEGDLLTGGILTTYFYGHFQQVGEALASGQIPRWNPWLSNGASLFGPRGGGVVYPANLLFAVFPLGHAFALYLALHFALAIEGARRLARRDGTAFGALVAGLAYGLGGFAVSMYGNPIFLVSAAWIPWAALGGARMRSDQARGVALVGSAVALCFLASEQQGGVTAALLAVCFAATAPKGVAKRRTSALLAALAVAVGLAAAGLTVVSTLALLPDTDRALSSFQDTEFTVAPLPTLLDLLVPGVVGLHADTSGGFWASRLGASNLWCVLSVGTVGIACLAAGLETRRRPALHGALALVLFGALLAAFDVGSPLNLRFPSKWLVVSALGLARLVGLGAEVLVVRRGRLGPILLHVLAILGLGAGAAALLAGDGLEAWLAGGDSARVDGAAARLTVAQALLRSGFVASVALLLLAVHRRLERRTRAALWLGLIVLDLLTANAPLIRTSEFPLLERPSLVAAASAASGRDRPHELGAPFPRLAPRADQLPAEVAIPPAMAAEGPSRLDASDLFYREVLWPNIGARHGVRTIEAFETVRPRALAALTSSRSFRDLPLAARMALLDANLVLVDIRERHPGLEPIELVSPVTPTVVLARNTLCPPWARLEVIAQPLPNLASALAAVCEGAPGVVLGPEGPLVEEPARVPRSARLVLTSFTAERIVFEVSADAGVWLVLREAYSDDWFATVDGEPVVTARADVLYRAVHVPAGTHRVTFAYAPGWWGWAVVLTVAGWLVLFACGLRGARGR